MKLYIGTRFAEGLEVIVRDTTTGKQYPLALRLDLFNHSPTGFECGYGGSGPAQLALAILADLIGPAEPPCECAYCGSKMNGKACSEAECGWDFREEEHKFAVRFHQDFKRDVVARLPHEQDPVGPCFVLRSPVLMDWVEARKFELKKSFMQL